MWELEDLSELEVEVQLDPAPAIADALVALAPRHLSLDPGGVESETVKLHADCLEESSGEW